MKTKICFILLFLILTIISGCVEERTYYISDESEKPSQVQPTVYISPIPYFDREKYEQYLLQQATRHQRYNSWKDAQNDYEWKLDLVKEQTTRLDMYYAAKAGVSMNQKEYESFLSSLRSATEEFVKRNVDAAATGRDYQEYLNAAYEQRDITDYDWYIREFNRIDKNRGITIRDIDKAIDNYNRVVDNYNSVFVYKN